MACQTTNSSTPQMRTIKNNGKILRSNACHFHNSGTNSLSQTYSISCDEFISANQNVNSSWVV